jgi:WD40 repeat protein
MKYHSLVLGLVGVALAPLAFAAAAEKTPAKKITYDDHVQPILRDKCLTCHGPDKDKGGLRLHTYTNLMTGSSSGEIVKAGDPEGSPMYRVLSHKQEPFMPPSSPMLAKESLETIRQWIAGGLLENAGSKARAPNKPKTDIGLTSVVKGRPPGPPPMPAVRLNLEPVVTTARANAVTALAASPWAPLVALAGHKQVLLYHSDNLELLGILPFPEGVPHVLKFSRNGSLLLAGGGRGGKSGKVAVWSVKTGQRILTIGDETDCVLAADISADQTQIALGGPGKMIRVYSTKDGQLLREIKKHTDWLTALEYSPDGVLLATGDRNGGVFVWEAYTGREYFSLRGHTAAITDLSWRADANVLASASEDTTIRLWEMENGNQVKAWGAHGGGVQSVRYASDGRIVSCGRDNVARMWDQNGSQQRAFEAFGDVALRVAFTHDAGRVVAGDWTGQVRIWTTADGKRVGTLNSNPLPIKDQLAAATKALDGCQAAYKPLPARANASQAAARKAATELAEAQRQAADTAAAARIVQEALARAKGPAAKANTDLAGVQAQVRARQLLARTLAEAAAKVKAEADKDKANKELATVAARSQDLAGQAASEQAAAEKQAASLLAAARAANDQLDQAQRAAVTTNASAVAAARIVAARTPVARAAAAQAVADQAALDRATVDLAAARARFEKLQSAVTLAKGPTRK